MEDKRQVCIALHGEMFYHKHVYGSPDHKDQLLTEINETWKEAVEL